MYNGSISTLHITETCEPFTNRFGSNVVEWDRHKYREDLFEDDTKILSEATNYKWQKWNVRPTEFNTKFMKTIFGRYLGLLMVKFKVYSKQ